MIRKMITVQLVLGAAAFAAPPVLTVERAPALPTHFECAAGTTRTTRTDQFACRDAKGALQGQAILLNKQGGVESIGRFEGGNRVGLWKHFDKNGVKEGETEFVADNFHGRRVFFYPNGQLKTVETWSNGARQGERITFDMNGVQTATTADNK